MFPLKDKNYERKIILDTNTYLQLLLIVPAVALVGLTGSSTGEGTVGHNYTGGFAQVVPRADDSEGRSFDRP
jgi:hypothetical protein